MSLLPKSIHRCRRYPTKFNSGRDIPQTYKKAIRANEEIFLIVSFNLFLSAKSAKSIRVSVSSRVS